MKKNRFNIIDGLVLLVIVAILLVFIFRNNIISNVTESEKKSIEFTVLLEDQRKEVLEQLEPGQKLFAEYRFQDGEVVRIEIFPTEEEQIMGDGTLRMVPVADRYSALVDLKAEADFDGPYIQLGGQEVKAGIDYIVKTEEFSHLGKIIKMQVTNYEDR